MFSLSGVQGNTFGLEEARKYGWKKSEIWATPCRKYLGFWRESWTIGGIIGQFTFVHENKM